MPLERQIQHLCGFELISLNVAIGEVVPLSVKVVVILQIFVPFSVLETAGSFAFPTKKAGVCQRRVFLIFVQ